MAGHQRLAADEGSLLQCPNTAAVLSRRDQAGLRSSAAAEFVAPETKRSAATAPGTVLCHSAAQHRQHGGALQPGRAHTVEAEPCAGTPGTQQGAAGAPAELAASGPACLEVHAEPGAPLVQLDNGRLSKKPAAGGAVPARRRRKATKGKVSSRGGQEGHSDGSNFSLSCSNVLSSDRDSKDSRSIDQPAAKSRKMRRASRDTNATVAVLKARYQSFVTFTSLRSFLVPLLIADLPCKPDVQNSLGVKESHAAAMCRLAEHGLSTSGRKADLAARLQAHEAGAAATEGLPAPSAAPVHGAGFAQGGLMPKGGKRKNFVRMNLKASGRAPCLGSPAQSKADR